MTGTSSVTKTRNTQQELEQTVQQLLDSGRPRAGIRSFTAASEGSDCGRLWFSIKDELPMAKSPTGSCMNTGSTKPPLIPPPYVL